MINFFKEHSAEGAAADIALVVGYRSAVHDPDKCGLQVIGGVKDVVKLTENIFRLNA